MLVLSLIPFLIPFQLLPAQELEEAQRLEQKVLQLSKNRRYEEAVPIERQALAIRIKILGQEHPDTAISMSNLGDLYRLQGEYERAKPFYVKALSVRSSKLGWDNHATAVTCNNLALIYHSQKYDELAKVFFLRALQGDEKSLGPDHPDVAIVLRNLGAIYFAQKQYDNAQPMLERALSIDEKAFGPKHPSVALVLNDLALIQEIKGAYIKAEVLLTRAMRIDEEVLGSDAAESLNCRYNLAVVLGLSGDWYKAVTNFEVILRSNSHQQALAFGGERVQQRVISIRRSTIAALHACASTSGQRDACLSLLLEAILSTKGRVTQEARASFEALRTSASGNDKALLLDFDKTLSAKAAIGDPKPKVEGQSTNEGIEQLRKYFKAGDDLYLLGVEERDLAAKIALRSAHFRKLLSDPTPETVAHLLRRRVLVEIVRTVEFQPTLGKAFGDSVYCALALFPNGHVKMADLGAAKPIDDLIVTYRQAQSVTDNREQVELLADRLGTLIFEPIQRMVGRPTEWYLAPDGQMLLMPFNALRSHGRYVAETHRIWTIGSGRDLVMSDLRDKNNGKQAKGGVNDLILANPDFGNGTSFPPLLETEQEAESIREVLPKAQMIEPANRTKAYLLNLPYAPRILHLSTHAFYHSNPTFYLPGEDDPTLRSGIALNGANLGPAGILTAKEAQKLRLSGTELVVVSACDTGLGTVHFEDGIIGLQRSLMLAGARTQMLTEWPVNASASRDFMVRFYRRLATGKSPKGRAWLDTQRELIRRGLAPHYWAPFVLFGDPGSFARK